MGRQAVGAGARPAHGIDAADTARRRRYRAYTRHRFGAATTPARRVCVGVADGGAGDGIRVGKIVDSRVRLLLQAAVPISVVEFPESIDRRGGRRVRTGRDIEARV